MGISSSYCWTCLRSQVHHLHCAYWKGACNLTGLNWFHKTNFWKSKCGDRRLLSENPDNKGKRCSATLFPINSVHYSLKLCFYLWIYKALSLLFFFILPQIQSIIYSYLLHISKNQIDQNCLVLLTWHTLHILYKESCPSPPVSLK